ncbi:MAG: hypothetical protein KBA53_11465 [Thermoclostridium sp.]|nr:hypothetical protein [Thermoclostridium sp.]
MKRNFRNLLFISILILAFVLSACGKNPVAGKPEITPTGSAAQPSGTLQPSEAGEVTPVIDAPKTIIRETVVQNMANLVFADSLPSELLSYVGEHIAVATPQEADSMLLILESIQNAWLEYYLERLDFSGNADPQIDQAYTSELALNGLKLTEVNRYKVPVIDYSLYRKWEGMLSGWFRDYIGIAQAETESPAVTNGNLAIPKEDLEKRLLITSGYIENYPQSIRFNQVLSLYDSYLYCYLYGYGKDAVINFSTRQISMDYYNRYLDFVKNNPDTRVSTIIAGYVSIIEKGSFLLTEEIERYLEQVFSNLEDQQIVVRNDIGRQILMERIGKLLPGRTGFTWNCIGTGKYKHTAALSEIHTEDGNPVYTVTGLVTDPSVAENPDVPANIELEYRIENNVLSQIKYAPFMPDSDFSGLELIRYPFVKGHYWYQYPEDEWFNNTEICTEIISVSQENGQNLYEVEYRDPSTGHYERRLLQEGKGTIAFTKLCTDDMGEEFEIGYYIDEANTGYPQPIVP